MLVVHTFLHVINYSANTSQLAGYCGLVEKSESNSCCLIIVQSCVCYRLVIVKSVFVLLLALQILVNCLQQLSSQFSSTKGYSTDVSVINVIRDSVSVKQHIKSF